MYSDRFNLVGSTVSGHYAVESVVAEGGFSIVYRARHTLWNRPVAIKAFHGADGLDAESREEMIRTFVQEGAMLAELSERTTAVVQARDIATTVTPAGDWVPFLVLEWLDGECLDAVLWRERQALLPPRTLPQAFALLDPVAKALALAHTKGICHRDVKPGNLFVLGDPAGATAPPSSSTSASPASSPRARAPRAGPPGRTPSPRRTRRPSSSATPTASPARGPTSSRSRSS
jgi:serine/threonine protein kinase